MKVGKISKSNKHAGWNFRNFITMDYGFSLKILKFNKSAGWNKGVQVGKMLKINKVCCTIIKETKVSSYSTFIVDTLDCCGALEAVL